MLSHFGFCFRLLPCKTKTCNQSLAFALQDNFEAGHVCWDEKDLMNGRPTGAIRFSFGLASSISDIQKILEFAQLHFVQASQPMQHIAASQGSYDKQVRLKEIWVYPIKSCKGVLKTRWWMGQNGLLLDREWALIDASGSIMTLKRYPQLATIAPSIDLAAGKQYQLMQSTYCSSFHL